jgi:hypothetical protein
MSAFPRLTWLEAFRDRVSHRGGPGVTLNPARQIDSFHIILITGFLVCLHAPLLSGTPKRAPVKTSLTGTLLFYVK